MTSCFSTTQKPFGNLTCDFYKNDNEFYMTREQIGAALEYSNPGIAIQKIHDLNADRLNPLSTVTKLVKVEGSREVTRDVIVHTLRGAMEICRFSRQLKADKFMDFTNCHTALIFPHLCAILIEKGDDPTCQNSAVSMVSYCKCCTVTMNNTTSHTFMCIIMAMKHLSALTVSFLPVLSQSNS